MILHVGAYPNRQALFIDHQKLSKNKGKKIFLLVDYNNKVVTPNFQKNVSISIQSQLLITKDIKKKLLNLII